MKRHIHIDPVGGLSGDMFISAMISAAPEGEAIMQSDLAAAGISAHISFSLAKVKKAGFAALQLSVDQHPEAPPTHHWKDIRAFIEGSALRTPVKTIALAIFGRLAEAEAACHDVPVDKVHFHEIADWDSVADIIAAASLIVSSGAESWSVSDLPIGQGRVMTQHGLIPVPAPATAKLLRGFPVTDDGVKGERITPTGAAILSYLAPTAKGPPTGARIDVSGVGAGQKDFEGVPNICRVLLFASAATAQDQVAEIAFEIDDMTPEEISVALDRIRHHDGVVDGGYTLGYGKKGRVRYCVTVLAKPHASDVVADLCFSETSTLGVRIGVSSRRILERRHAQVGALRAKTAERPNGATAKVESDDLSAIPTLKARREAAALAEATDD